MDTQSNRQQFMLLYNSTKGRIVSRRQVHLVQDLVSTTTGRIGKGTLTGTPNISSGRTRLLEKAMSLLTAEYCWLYRDVQKKPK